MADIRKFHYNVEGKKKGIPVILIIYDLIKYYRDFKMRHHDIKAYHL